MAKEVSSLKDIIQFNKNFKTAINLYLSLNKPEKVLGYIPTKSSVNIMSNYLSAVLENKEQATLLVGPYGKGKSHLLLVLLAILSMERNPDKDKIAKTLINNIKKVDEIGESVADEVKKVWKKKRFLPVLITDTTGDLNQAFIVGLNEALKREGLQNLSPNTYYSIALERIADWKKNYKNSYKLFEKELSQKSINMSNFMADLKMCSRESLSLFKNIYPKVTSGSEFNPITISEVLPLYKNIGEILVEEYDFSGIYIVFDEFSKFIESQDGTAGGTNMRLLQDICELSTDSEHAQFFITMVAHKSIKEYGKYLTQDIINSFTGIEGRIIENYFITSSKNNYELIKNAIIKDEKQLLENSHCKSYFDGTNTQFIN